MKHWLRAFGMISFSILLLTLVAAADEGPLDKSEPKGITPEEIIKRFSVKEKEFKEARDLYTYRQDVTVQHRWTEIRKWRISPGVRRYCSTTRASELENVVFAPQSSLEPHLRWTRKTFEDIRNRLPFVLTSDEIAEYNILYVGMQQEDDLHCYVFDIAPKEIVGKKRYFQGRIWVDDH